MRAFTSLGFAVRNLDGRLAAEHVTWVRQVRQDEGDDAAWLSAQDLVLQLYYPRSELPILLGEELPPADRTQR